MINYNKDQHSKTELPVCVVEWAGLEERNPQVFTGDDTKQEYIHSFSTLSELNDGGKDFKFIADLIDRHL
jgi:hypothetical protein